MSSLLPLFPLELVLLPGAPLPLHIFEPRYKEMIGECLAQKSEFGVVRASEQGLAEIGCTAAIIAVTQRYPDGKLDIVTQGRRRFAIVHVDRERSFFRGEVLFLEDEPAAPSKEDLARAVWLHAEVLTLAGTEQDLSMADPALMSYYLAGSLPLDLDFKQDLLGHDSELKRIALLTAYLETLLPKLRYALNARRKAGGNGHAH